ncbi:helix-turn-helix domain-containing protein, partial [Halomonas piscis]|uniref:helix-turn-helix domain-containing protein n=1 Tax=Halomonas piscis TaxID=3031727 RepID=UPI0028974DAB
MSYVELSIEERATIQVSHVQGMSLRHIARIVERAPSTISREVRRNLIGQRAYCARQAQQQRQRRRAPCRPKRKLIPGTERFELI